MLYVGTDDGYVMQLDVGTSFDGEPIPHVLGLAYANQGAVTAYKRYFTMRPDVKSEGGPLAVSLYAQFDYGGLRGDQVDGVGVPATGSTYGFSLYGVTYYGAPSVGDAQYDIDGVGFNISPTFIHEDDIDSPATFEANTIEFTPTKMRK